MARFFSGQRVQELRTARGLTREHLAVMINRSYFTVQAYELGRVVPDGDMIASLADALNAPVGDFFAEGATARVA